MVESTHFLGAFSQRPPRQKRSSSDNFFHRARHPQFPWKGISTLADSPPYRRSQETAHIPPRPGDLCAYLSNLVVQEEVLQTPPESSQFFPSQPGKNICAQREGFPLLERLRFPYAHLPELWPDRNAGVGSEDIWRKTDICILFGDVAHDAECLLAMRLGLARIPENNVENDVNARKIGFARCLHHLFDVLKTLVHQSQHFLGGGLGAKADVVHSTLRKQSHVLLGH